MCIGSSDDYCKAGGSNIITNTTKGKFTKVTDVTFEVRKQHHKSMKVTGVAFEQGDISINIYIFRISRFESLCILCVFLIACFLPSTVIIAGVDGVH